MIPDYARRAVHAALTILPMKMDSPEARVMLYAIGLQESRFLYRVQIVNGGGRGLARGLWQFELGTRDSRGGVWGVYLHHASAGHLKNVCETLDCEFNPAAIYSRIETDDVMASAVARLLLWTDAKPLPKLNDVDGAWDLYALRTWRPGKPHRLTWDRFHRQAVEAVDRRKSLRIDN